MAKIAYLFPGQGSQSVGMGRDFYEQSASAKKIYETFDRCLAASLSDGLTLSRICFEGPEAALQRTIYTQPAILATSLAALTVFQEKANLQPVYTAGHSLGEYGALYASGVVDLETVVKLVAKRAELMENAPKGAMSAVLGLPETQIEKVLMHLHQAGKGPIVIANYNTGEQYVISGTVEAVHEATPQLKDAGAKRVIPLAVGGAFHSPLMDEVSETFRNFLKDFRFQNANPPVIANVDALGTTDAFKFPEKLSEQINHPVRWNQTLSFLFVEERVDTVIEFGPNKVLTGMVKRVYPDIQTFNVSDMASLNETVDQLRTTVGVGA